MKHLVFTCLLVILPLSIARAEPPSLIFPLDCERGRNCRVVNYMDVTKDDVKAVDFACGARTYDEHKGTDIGLRDRVMMESGINVLAAADGTVLRARDGAEDQAPGGSVAVDDKKKCGNGVFIDHGGGWRTIYCHMKQDSVLVKPDQQIKAGEVLGQAGRSGDAAFPQLHIGVFHNNVPIDPFTGFSDTDGCGLKSLPLWQDKTFVYEQVAFYAAGFSATVPDFDRIIINITPTATLNIDSDILAFWVAFYGAVEGDEISMKIFDPEGRLFAVRKVKQSRTRARQFYFVGKKLSEKKLIAGKYEGQAVLTRIMPDGSHIKRDISVMVKAR